MLRKLRTDAGLTQEELAEAARISVRSVSDLERGINQTARKDTARLLADALNLTGSARTEFEAIARGRVPAEEQASSPGSGVATATRTLPRDITSFTGRESELRELVDAVVNAPGSGAVVGVHAIGGMAGVGKTAFAVHAAYQLAPRFPAGQLFLPLHGHTPGQRPVDPADALASLLLTAGVPVQQIPAGLEARMALWRDRLAGKQLLLVLDDAADSEQVRPLLPGSGESLVLVTSRRHLTALEDARTISLDILPQDEAAALLIHLANRPGLSPDDAAVRLITRQCGYLPLAIGMLARQLHHHQAWTPADLAADLAAARDRLELMQTENLSVAVAFDLSYEDLSAVQRQMFRRLGLHPGADIDAYAAAALDDIDVTNARRHLRALYDQYLLAEPVHDRYRLHDLIREHARARAASDDPEIDREQAMNRLVDYYQHVAAVAAGQFTRYTRSLTGAVPTPPPALPDLAGSRRALSWARTERGNLFACLDHAARADQHARVVTFTAALADLLQHDGPWTDAMIRHEVALRAACRMGDQIGEASALLDLGVLRLLAGDHRASADALERSLTIFRHNQDRQGEVNALNYLGVIRQLTTDFPAAIKALDQSLDIARHIHDRRGQARALGNLGHARLATGDLRGAIKDLQEALEISREIQDQPGQARTLRFLGAAKRRSGDYGGAADALREALVISEDFGTDRSGGSCRYRR